MAEPPNGENVVSLGVEPAAEPPREPTPMGRAHSLGTIGMALCAFLGIIALLSLITVRWPEDTGRIPRGVLLFSVVGFMVCAAIAAAGAARATYPREIADGSREADTPE
ncbi:MAG: hypothetical protein ABR505_03070 [Actinomycetota bacterium]